MNRTQRFFNSAEGREVISRLLDVLHHEIPKEERKEFHVRHYLDWTLIQKDRQIDVGIVFIKKDSPVLNFISVHKEQKLLDAHPFRVHRFSGDMKYTKSTKGDFPEDLEDEVIQGILKDVPRPTVYEVYEQNRFKK